MAICIEFELIEINEKKKKFQYRPCLEEHTGLFEVDFSNIDHNEAFQEMTLD